MRFKTSFIFLPAIVLLFCGQITVFAQHRGKSLDFLIGTWKVENKESFEVWEKDSGGELTGSMYKIKDGQKIVTETLRIKTVDGKVRYLAALPDQNEGRPVSFTLTGSADGEYTFENPEHDFPKKIVYKRLSANELFVRVSGDNGKGFSLTLRRSD